MIPTQRNPKDPAHTVGISRFHRYFFVLWSLLPLCFSVGLSVGFSGAALAKGKPLSWKVIDDALLRVNGSAVKDWSVSQSGKKNDPLLLKIGNRFLLIEIRDHRVFEIDPATVQQKADEQLWSLGDRPTKPLSTSAWDTEDLGSALRIALKLDSENRSFDLQLPHPPDVGDLPSHPAGSTNSRHRY